MAVSFLGAFQHVANNFSRPSKTRQRQREEGGERDREEKKSTTG